MAEFKRYLIGISVETTDGVEQLMEFTVKTEDGVGKVTDAVVHTIIQERGTYAPPALKEMIAPAPQEPKPVESPLW